MYGHALRRQGYDTVAQYTYGGFVVFLFKIISLYLQYERKNSILGANIILFDHSE